MRVFWYVLRQSETVELPCENASIWVPREGWQACSAGGPISFARVPIDRLKTWVRERALRFDTGTIQVLLQDPRMCHGYKNRLYLGIVHYDSETITDLGLVSCASVHPRITFSDVV